MLVFKKYFSLSFLFILCSSFIFDATAQNSAQEIIDKTFTNPIISTIKANYISLVFLTPLLVFSFYIVWHLYTSYHGGYFGNIYVRHMLIPLSIISAILILLILVIRFFY